MSATPNEGQSTAFAPSGRCDVCVHGEPLDADCAGCAAERWLDAAELTAQQDAALPGGGYGVRRASLWLRWVTLPQLYREPVTGFTYTIVVKKTESQTDAGERRSALFVVCEARTVVSRGEALAYLAGLERGE